MRTSLVDGLQTIGFENYDQTTLVIESEALRGNPLGDSCIRRNPMLVPKQKRKGLPVVVHLSGFTGNGPGVFNAKLFETSTPVLLDRATSRGEAPAAVHVFCDAMTSWGGSQFINSEGQGNYGDYAAREIPRAIREIFPEVSSDAGLWCVTGGSSGGYGAIELATRHPKTFGVLAAIAPDAFFEANLLHEVRLSLPMIEKIGGVGAVRQEILDGKFMKRKDAHMILNVIAMGLCYAADGKQNIRWPVDPTTGEVTATSWKEWLRHDPLHFLRQRRSSITQLKAVLLDCGRRDQFNLQYGARQLKEIFSEANVFFRFSEFDGTHFEIGERRPEVWKWLATLWR